MSLENTKQAQTVTQGVNDMKSSSRQGAADMESSSRQGVADMKPFLTQGQLMRRHP